MKVKRHVVKMPWLLSTPMHSCGVCTLASLPVSLCLEYLLHTCAGLTTQSSASNAGKSLFDSLEIAPETWTKKWGSKELAETGIQSHQKGMSRKMKNIEENLATLEEWGLDKEGQRKVALHTYSIARLTPEIFKKKLEWLVDEFDFEKQDAVKAVKVYPSYFQYGVVENVAPFLCLFKREGYPKPVIRKMIQKHPRILGHHAKYKYLVGVLNESLGMTESQVLGLIIKFPKIFSYSYENNVAPMLEKYQEVGLSKEEVKNLVEICPSIMVGRNFEKSISSKLDWLRDQVGLSAGEALTVLKTAPNTFFATLQCWQESAAYFTSFGLNKLELLEFFKQDYTLLGRKAEGLKEKADFARQVLKREKEEFLAYPHYFGVPFENALLLRVAFLRHKGMCVTSIPLNELCGLDTEVFFGKYNGADEFLALRENWSVLPKEKKLAYVEMGSLDSSLLSIQ